MDGLDQIDFNVSFNDLPSNIEELRKNLSPEERKCLEDLPELDLEYALNEDNPTLLIRRMYGKEDMPSLSLTHDEVTDALFHSPWFLKGLNVEQRKVVGQFLTLTSPENKKILHKGCACYHS
eukprot:TRINITY_DN6114_c0_g1_i5.p1 TRINITY_DN6114_c0_g1~~TRINITY_DN6114_c0_g1_i5.p1  ORF type:complete len:122 (-),score=30.34 TRINITY_DN6114_c0_g1_i5:197-562(-)